MKTYNNEIYASSQVKSNLKKTSSYSLSYRTRKSLKRLIALDTKYKNVASLGPNGLAVINLIEQTNNKFDKCIYKAETIADKIGVVTKTVQRKIKSLLDMGVVMQKLVHKRGFKKTMDRWINPEFLRANTLKLLFSCLLLSEVSHITNFTNVPRLYNEYIIYKKSSQAVPQLRVADGGVPPGATTSDIDSFNKLQKTEVDAIFGSVFTIPAIKYPSNTLEPAACLLSQGVKMSEQLIPSYILDLKSVHLTKAGQAAVSAFSKEILEAADSKLLRYKGSLRNRVGYFLKLCHELSREKNLLPDYDYAAYLHQQLGTDESMPLMVRNAPVSQTLLRPGGFVGQAQKGEKAALCTESQSTVAPGGTPPSLSSPLRPGGFVGQARVLLSDQEAEQRRAAFMNDPEVIAGIDKLAKLIGRKEAEKFFAMAVENQKYDFK